MTARRQRKEEDINMEQIIAIMVVIMIWAFIVFMIMCFASEIFKLKHPFWDTLMTVSCNIALGLAMILLLIWSFIVVDKYIW